MGNFERIFTRLKAERNGDGKTYPYIGVGLAFPVSFFSFEKIFKNT